MGKRIVIGIGAFMVFMGVIGTFNAVVSLGKADVVKTDITTTGKVTSVSGTELRHRIGVTIDTSYRLKFAFNAEDGKTYNGEQTTDQAAFNSLSKGQPIKVMYHSDNPNINGAPDYGSYVSVAELPNASPLFRFGFCLANLILGAGILYLGFFVVNDDETESPKKIETPFDGQGSLTFKRDSSVPMS